MVRQLLLLLVVADFTLYSLSGNAFWQGKGGPFQSRAAQKRIKLLFTWLQKCVGDHILHSNNFLHMLYHKLSPFIGLEVVKQDKNNVQQNKLQVSVVL